VTAALQALLVVIAQIAPSLTSSAAIQAVVNALVQIVPVLIKEVQDLIPMVKNIIAALSANAGTTSDQLNALAALDAQCDAAFEAAAAAAEAEDGTSTSAPPTPPAQ